MKLTKYQQNKIADLKRSKKRLVPFYQILCQHGTISMTELQPVAAPGFRSVRWI